MNRQSDIHSDRQIDRDRQTDSIKSVTYDSVLPEQVDVFTAQVKLLRIIKGTVKCWFIGDKQTD